jgi:chromosome segregation ATPase
MLRFFAVGLLSALPLALQAQTQSSDATIQALLAEVRQLRLALQQSAVVAPKIQVTLQRIQLQQDQVSRLSRQLEEVRGQIAHFSSEAANLSAEIKVVESRLLQEQDPTRRNALEAQLKDHTMRYERDVAQQKLQEAQHQQLETELTGRLHTEQGKLDELNGKLDALERTLEPPQPKQP